MKRDEEEQTLGGRGERCGGDSRGVSDREDVGIRRAVFVEDIQVLVGEKATFRCQSYVLSLTTSRLSLPSIALGFA